MEPYKKRLIYLNAIFLVLQATCTAESIITPPSDLLDEENKAATDIDANIDITTIQPEVEDLFEPIRNLINSVNETAINNENRDGELDDLGHGGIFENIPKTIDEDDVVILPVPIDNDQQGPTSQIEWIEDDEEGGEEEDPDAKPIVQAMVGGIEEERDATIQGQLGIVVALFLVMFLVVGYAGFVVWRRFIERRYGNRQILINEEDMVDPNDMKHFSL